MTGKVPFLRENVAERHPIMRYFEYEHLPEKLKAYSKPFCELAQLLDEKLPNGPEKAVALRKLLEGKDAAVRAALDIPDVS